MKNTAPAAPSLTLYSRSWCHLCEEMLTELEPLARAFGASVEVLDVDADPALVERYDELVPVLVYEGVELSRYRLDVERVRAALATRAA
ncbi:glutaredoxin family protein [Trinickia sp. Y13]|uniref:glutaredoxin family protein n=1 Tax=Trinickia sp. Y13 TaxID=2917807 RepID=UPI002405A857|nr:glutaredoxin family protein [Trinickia sp. Y13]MDG0027088.1 glutaredoxin family protein [Trinickia sp. Y13]